MACLCLLSQAKDILNKAGAKCHAYMGEQVKIAISETTDDEHEYSEISEIYDIPVVSCRWVIESHKCGKTLPTAAFPPLQTSTGVFKGQVFCASAGLSKSDMNSLWAMITFYGGTVQRSLNQDVTHLLCTNTSSKKYILASTFPKVKIVTPDWVVKCVKTKTTVSEAEFHPKLLAGSSSPALRRQLLSPVIPPTELKKKSTANRSPKQKAKASSVVFQQTSTSPAVFSHSSSPVPPVAYQYPPRSRPNRPKLHEMPSGFPPFPHEGNMLHMNQSMIGASPRHPQRPQSSLQFDSGYMPAGYGVSPGPSVPGLGAAGHIHPAPGQHQVSTSPIY